MRPVSFILFLEQASSGSVLYYNELFCGSKGEIYMKGIDTSYYYEGYTVYKAEELS